MPASSHSKRSSSKSKHYQYDHYCFTLAKSVGKDGNFRNLFNATVWTKVPSEYQQRLGRYPSHKELYFTANLDSEYQANQLCIQIRKHFKAHNNTSVFDASLVLRHSKDVVVAEGPLLRALTNDYHLINDNCSQYDDLAHNRDRHVVKTIASLGHKQAVKHKQAPKQATIKNPPNHQAGVPTSKQPGGSLATSALELLAQTACEYGQSVNEVDQSSSLMDSHHAHSGNVFNSIARQSEPNYWVSRQPGSQTTPSQYWSSTQGGNYMQNYVMWQQYEQQAWQRREKCSQNPALASWYVTLANEAQRHKIYYHYLYHGYTTNQASQAMPPATSMCDFNFAAYFGNTSYHDTPHNFWRHKQSDQQTLQENMIKGLNFNNK